MRRGLSIFLILLFGLGPLAAALPARAESRLPACCRRNGEHHCAMDAIQVLQSGTDGAFSSPARCPLYPANQPASVKPVHALAPKPAALPALRKQEHTQAASRVRITDGPLCTRASRGPPAILPS